VRSDNYRGDATFAVKDGRSRPPRDCFTPYGFGEYVILNAGQVLLDFAGSVQHVDAVGEMRPGFHALSVL
jgi:hypothetical protein